PIVKTKTRVPINSVTYLRICPPSSDSAAARGATLGFLLQHTGEVPRSVDATALSSADTHPDQGPSGPRADSPAEGLRPLYAVGHLAITKHLVIGSGELSEIR